MSTASPHDDRLSKRVSLTSVLCCTHDVVDDNEPAMLMIGRPRSSSWSSTDAGTRVSSGGSGDDDERRHSGVSYLAPEESMSVAEMIKSLVGFRKRGDRMFKRGKGVGVWVGK